MRLAWVPVVVVVCLGVVWGTALAQEPSVPADPTTDDGSTPKRVFQSLRQFGSFGVQVGGMRFLADSDASDGALVRPSLQGVFRYRFNENWVGVGEFGFGWGAFKDRGDTVLAVTSGTIGAYRHLSSVLDFDTKIGAGLGVYRWNYKIKGKSVRDPESQLHLKDTNLGLFTGVEFERRISKHTTFLFTNQFHFLFSSNKDEFPALLGGSDAFYSFRFGVNYHFSPYEGILWERETKRVIRLESGKAGS